MSDWPWPVAPCSIAAAHSGHSWVDRSNTWWFCRGVEPIATTADFAGSVAKVYDEAQALLLRKHQDYGPSNISRSPGGPLNGLRVRMWDKTARINNLIDSGVEPANESLRDSFLDLLNYSAIALLVLDGDWPDA